MNAEVFKEYEDTLHRAGWIRVPGDRNSFIVQWRHATLPGRIHLSVGESGKGWRHYVQAPFPCNTGADVASLRGYLTGDAIKNLRVKG